MRMAEKSATGHPDFNPMDWSWYQSSKLNRLHANNQDLTDRQSDREPIWKAFELAGADDFQER
jgi:hypothetical protein